MVLDFQVSPPSVTSGEPFKISYKVSSNCSKGLKQVELWRKDESSDWQEIKPPNTLAGETGPVSGSFTDAPLAPGKYCYGVHVVDNAGNWNDERNSNTDNQESSFEPVEVEVKSIRQSDQASISYSSTPLELLRLNTGNHVNSIAFSPDGSKLATGGSNPRGACIWDVVSGEKLHKWGYNNDLDNYTVAFSPDGSKLATGGEYNIYIWDAASGELVLKINNHCHSLAFSPDGSKIVSGDDYLGVSIWDAVSGEKLHILKNNFWYSDERSVSFSPDGSKLATVGCEKAIIWDMITGEMLHQLRPGWPPIAFSPDGNKIAMGSNFDPISIWDVANGEKLLELNPGGYSVSFSPDGSKLVTGNKDSIVRIWDAVTGADLLKMEAAKPPAVFSPDGSKLATGSYDSSVIIWDIANG